MRTHLRRRSAADVGPGLPVPALVAARLVGAALVLGGCGAGEREATDPGASAAAASPSASSPASPASPSTSAAASPGSPDVEPPWRLVAIVSDTAAGGAASTTGVRLDDAAAVLDFGSQFTRPALVQELAQAAEAADVPVGSALYAAVVAVGCDVPPGVLVDTESGADGAEQVVITGAKVTTPPVQCLAPVTSVALVTVAVD